MARLGHKAGHMVRGALDVKIGHEILKVFGASAPWVFMFFIAPVLSTLFYLLWHNSGFIIWVLFLAVAFLLSFWELRMTHTKSGIGKTLILLTLNFWVLWFAAASQYGIWTRPTLDVFFVGGITLGIMWNMRTMVRGRDDESGAINWNQIDEKAGFDGKTRFKQLPNIGKTIVGKIKLKDGMTFKQLSNSGDAIKAMAGLPQNGLRFQPNPDDASEVEVRMVLEDVLRHKVEWEKSAFAGQSVAAGPIKIGLYEDGEPAVLNLFSPAGAKHLIISGMNGSGKSVGARNILADLMLRSDVKIFAVDVVKGAQTLGPMAKGLDLFFTNAGTGNLFLTRMKSTIQKRADYLGRQGMDTWQPGCGLDFIVLIVEEGAAFVNDSDDFTRVVEQARSAGVAIILSIQRASHTNMSTDARSQFASALCFGVNSDQDARFVLSEEVLDRGADPSVWKANKPGYAYLEAYGVPEERHATPLKTMELSAAELREACEETNPRDVDDFTKNSLGNIYEEKHGKMNIELKVAETDEDKAEQIIAAIKHDLDPDFEEEEITEFDEQMIHEEFEGPALVFGEASKKKMSPDEARAEFDKYLVKLQSQGTDVFAVRDLYPLMEATGRVRGWIHAELTRRKKNGTIAHNSEDGSYQVITAVDSAGETIEDE